MREDNLPHLPAVFPELLLLVWCHHLTIRKDFRNDEDQHNQGVFLHYLVPEVFISPQVRLNFPVEFTAAKVFAL